MNETSSHKVHCWACEGFMEEGIVIEIKRTDRWPYLGFINALGIFENTYNRSPLPKVETFVCSECYERWRSNLEAVGQSIPSAEELPMLDEADQTEVRLVSREMMSIEEARKWIETLREGDRKTIGKMGGEIGEEIGKVIIDWFKNTLFKALSKRERRRICKRLGIAPKYLAEPKERKTGWPMK